MGYEVNNFFSFYKHSKNWDGNPVIQHYEGDNFSYIPIPKCASTTMMKTFGIKNYDLINPKQISNNGKFKFTFVRNPYSRLVSCWYGKIKKRWGSDITNIHGFYYDMTFDDFIQQIYYTDYYDHEQHFAPYNVILDGLDVDFVGKVESFETDYDKIKVKFNLPEVLKNSAITNTGKEYDKLFNRETFDMVNEKFYRDFIDYGYKMK